MIELKNETYLLTFFIPTLNSCDCDVERQALTYLELVHFVLYIFFSFSNFLILRIEQSLLFIELFLVTLLILIYDNKFYNTVNQLTKKIVVTQKKKTKTKYLQYIQLG